MATDYGAIKCEEMAFQVSILDCLDGAILLCDVADEQDAEEIRSECTPLEGEGKNSLIYQHLFIPCIETYTRLISNAMVQRELVFGRENGVPTDETDHVAYSRRRFTGREFLAWLDNHHPTLRPKILFGDRPAPITVDSRDLEVATQKIRFLQIELENLRAENASLKTAQEKAPITNHQATKSAENDLTTIGVLIDLILERDRTSINSKFGSEADIISWIQNRYPKAYGLGQRTLESRFRRAKKTLRKFKHRNCDSFGRNCGVILPYSSNHPLHRKTYGGCDDFKPTTRLAKP